MLFIYNNCAESTNWEAAYRQLSINYLQITGECQQAEQLGCSLRERIAALERENELIRARKVQVKAEIHLNEDCQEAKIQQPTQREITTRLPKRSPPPMKTKSSTEMDSRTDVSVFECTYEGCRRIYGSSVSMNLHIKQKHNGGTKKERQAYAKLLLDAEERGEPLPAIAITLPPNFLDEFRTSYAYMKKYSM